MCVCAFVILRFGDDGSARTSVPVRFLSSGCSCVFFSLFFFYIFYLFRQMSRWIVCQVGLFLFGFLRTRQPTATYLKYSRIIEFFDLGRETATSRIHLETPPTLWVMDVVRYRLVVVWLIVVRLGRLFSFAVLASLRYGVCWLIDERFSFFLFRTLRLLFCVCV